MKDDNRCQIKLAQFNLLMCSFGLNLIRVITSFFEVICYVYFKGHSPGYLQKSISKAFLKLVLAEKWLTLIAFAVSIIQSLSRKGARYGFNMPNRYLITQTEKYEPDKKYFSDKAKCFKNFEIVLEYFQVCHWNTALWEKRKR